MASDDFSRPPRGIDGIVALVTAQPALQVNLVDMLEQFPVDRCGAWVVNGWNNAITGTDPKARLSNLIQRWADQDANKALKMVAAATIGTGGRR